MTVAPHNRFCLAFGFLLSIVSSSRTLSAAPFLRADTDQNGAVEITDPIRTLGFLFLGSPAGLGCDDAADSNDDGKIDLSDAVATLTYLFLGGKDLPLPGAACGEDPTEDSLGCGSHAACVSGPGPLDIVDPPFIVDIVANRLSGIPGTLFLLSGGVAPATVIVKGWEWSFSDGRTLTGPEAQVSFDQPGDVFVRLRVQDATGREATGGTLLKVFDPDATPEEPRSSISPAAGAPGTVVHLDSPALLDPRARVEIQIDGLPAFEPFRPEPGVANFVVPLAAQEVYPQGSSVSVRILAEGDAVDELGFEILPNPVLESAPGTVIRAAIEEASALLAALGESTETMLAEAGHDADEIAAIRSMLDVATTYFLFAAGEIAERLPLVDAATLARIDQILLAQGIGAAGGGGGETLNDKVIDGICELQDAFERVKQLTSGLQLIGPILHVVALVGGPLAPALQGIALACDALGSTLAFVGVAAEFLPSVDFVLKLVADKPNLANDQETATLEVHAVVQYKVDLCSEPINALEEALKKFLVKSIAARFPTAGAVQSALQEAPGALTYDQKIRLTHQAEEAIRKSFEEKVGKAVTIKQIADLLKKASERFCARELTHDLPLPPDGLLQPLRNPAAGSISDFTATSAQFHPAHGFSGPVLIEAQRQCGERKLQGVILLHVGKVCRDARQLVDVYCTERKVINTPACDPRMQAFSTFHFQNLSSTERIVVVMGFHFSSACDAKGSGYKTTVKELGLLPGESQEVEVLSSDNCCGETFGDLNYSGIAVTACATVENEYAIPAEAHFAGGPAAGWFRFPELSPIIQCPVR